MKSKKKVLILIIILIVLCFGVVFGRYYFRMSDGLYFDYEDYVFFDTGDYMLLDLSVIEDEELLIRLVENLLEIEEMQRQMDKKTISIDTSILTDEELYKVEEMFRKADDGIISEEDLRDFITDITNRELASTTIYGIRFVNLAYHGDTRSDIHFLWDAGGRDGGKHTRRNTGTHQWITRRAFDILEREKLDVLEWFGGIRNENIIIQFSDWPDCPASDERGIQFFWLIPEMTIYLPHIAGGITHIPEMDLRAWTNHRHFYHYSYRRNFLRQTANQEYNAVTRFIYWYDKAVRRYQAGDRYNAFRALGKSIHFLADLGSPPHTGDILPAELFSTQPLVFTRAMYDTGIQIRNHTRYEDLALLHRSDARIRSGGRYDDWLVKDLYELGRDIAGNSYRYYAITQRSSFGNTLPSGRLQPQYEDAIINPLRASQQNVAGLLYRFYRTVVGDNYLYGENEDTEEELPDELPQLGTIDPLENEILEFLLQRPLGDVYTWWSLCSLSSRPDNHQIQLTFLENNTIAYSRFICAGYSHFEMLENKHTEFSINGNQLIFDGNIFTIHTMEPMGQGMWLASMYVCVNGEFSWWFRLSVALD